MSNSATGAIRNLNALPLIYGMDDRSDLHVDTPRRIVALFEQGQLETALMPAIEIAKHEGWEALLECGAIVSNGASRTMLLIASKPLAEVRRVALDTHARSSAALAQVLFANLDSLDPTATREFESIDITAGRVESGYDAVVVSGEAALTWPGYDPRTGELEGEGVYLLDLGEAWSEWTGLPFVSLVWTARETRDIGEWHDVLHGSAQSGLEKLDEVASFAAQRLQGTFDAAWLTEFFRSRVVSTLEESHREAMVRFFNEANALGLAPVMGTRGIHFRPRIAYQTDEAAEQDDTSKTDMLAQAIREIDELDAPLAESTTPSDTPRGAITERLAQVEPLAEPAGAQEKPFYVAPVDTEGPEPMVRARSAFLRRRYRAVLRHLADGAKREPGFAQRPDVLLLRARCEMHLERADEARRNLARAAEHPESHRFALYLFARLHMHLDNYEAAASKARQLLVEYPGDVSYAMHAHAILATCALHAGLTESAQMHRELAERRGLTSSDLLVEHGKALVQAQMWDDAAAYFGEAVNVDPSNPEAVLRLAQIFYHHGHWMKSEEVLAFGLDRAPEEVAFFKLLGDLRREQDKLRDAVTLYRVALEHSPRGDCAPVLIERIALCLHEQGESEDAREHLEVIRSHFPATKQARRADHFEQALGRAGDATRHVLAEVRSPTHYASFAGPRLAAALFAFHGMEEAAHEVPEAGQFESYGFSEYRQLLEAGGGTALYLRGNRERIKQLLEAELPVLFAQHRGLDESFALIVGYDDALDALVLREEESPGHTIEPWPTIEKRWAPTNGALLVFVPPARAELIEQLDLVDDELLKEWTAAEFAMALDNVEVARTHASNADSLDPHAQGPQKLLVEIELQAREAESALARCDAVLERDSESFWARKYRGDALLQQEKFAEALESYREALCRHRTEYTLWWVMGMAYEMLGNPMRAIQCYRRAVHLEMQPQIAGRIATLYADAQRPVEAAFWYGIVAELDPEDEAAQSALESYEQQPPEPLTPLAKRLAPFVLRVPVESARGTVAGHDQTIDELERKLKPEQAHPGPDFGEEEDDFLLNDEGDDDEHDEDDDDLDLEDPVGPDDVERMIDDLRASDDGEDDNNGEGEDENR